jgi:hypothetical protein
MKKLLLIFAIFMAFAVKSFAYTGSGLYDLSEVGSITYWITMESQSAGAQMGCDNPGYVEVTFYANGGADYLTGRVDYPGSSKSFYWIKPTLECQVTIEVWQYLHYSNGAYLTWGD